MSWDIVCTAKGATETLKFNMALILFPVCRNTITWLRSTWLSSVVPFNDNINFHKVKWNDLTWIWGQITILFWQIEIVCVVSVVGVILHGGTHLGYDFPRIVKADHYTFQQTIAMDFHWKQPSYTDIILTTEVISGISMFFLMAIAFLLATRISRRNLLTLPWPLHRLTGFNAFWYSHHLFVIVYILLIIHSIFLFLAHDWIQKTVQQSKFLSDFFKISWSWSFPILKNEHYLNLMLTETLLLSNINLQTWIYLAFPVMLYGGERTLRAFRASRYKVKILKVWRQL